MSFVISTVNVNGIRAAVKQRSEDNKGLIDWVERTTPDVVLMQEVRANDKDSAAALAPLIEAGWHWQAHPSEAKKGHAGVGILSRHELTNVTTGIGSFTDVGRYIQADVPQLGITVASLYLPSGSQGTEKQDEKYRFLDEFETELSRLADEHPAMIIGGDWNICHRREDIKNWKTNRKKSGFIADERAFMDAVFGVWPDDQSQSEGHGDFFGAVDYQPPSHAPRKPAADPKWFDVARRLNGDCEGPYTWWTYRGKAFDTDAGWRIDYQAATRTLCDRATHTWVDKAESYDMRWSDHSPLNVRYE